MTHCENCGRANPGALLDRIKAVRVLIAAAEAEVFGRPHSRTIDRRQSIARQSVFLEGLEEAARLLGISVPPEGDMR